MKQLDLEQLKKGTIGITEVVGAYLAQAAAYFLELNGHKSSVVLEVEGIFNEQFELIWKETVDERVKRSWRDNLEATEYGAVGIATLLSEKLLNLSVVERSYIGTQVDYILGVESSDERPFVPKARLEVSGIGMETTKNSINKRIKVKFNQVKKSADPNLPTYIIVIEFGTPKAKIAKYETSL